MQSKRLQSREFSRLFLWNKCGFFSSKEKRLCPKGVGIVNKKILFCGLLCMICLSGCGKRELLKEKLDAAKIDKVVVTMAMGNPAYGADAKVITDPKEVQDFVFLFNNAEVDEKIDKEDEWVALSGSYTFFSGEEQVAKFNVNANDPERIWINDAFYEIEYPDDMLDPYGLYSYSDAEIIVVDENGQEMIRPEE